jgi:hypothetical protein
MAEEIRSRQLLHLVLAGELDAWTRYFMVHLQRTLDPGVGAAVSAR